MKNFIKILFFSFFLFLGASNVYAEDNKSGNPDAIKIKKEDGNKEIARKIAESGGNSSFLQQSVQSFKETRLKIQESFRNPDNDIKTKMCEMRKQLLVDTGNIAKAIKPFVMLLLVVIVLLAIKKLFIDNPEQQPNGLTSNVLKGFFFLLIAVALAQYGAIIEWWEQTIIPDFSSLCSGGKDTALSSVFLREFLYLLFVLVQFFGAIIVVLGISDLVKKDRTGNVNIYGVMTKVIGGILFLSYKHVLDWIGVIQIG